MQRISSAFRSSKTLSAASRNFSGNSRVFFPPVFGFKILDVGFMFLAVPVTTLGCVFLLGVSFFVSSFATVFFLGASGFVLLGNFLAFAADVTLDFTGVALVFVVFRDLAGTLREAVVVTFVFDLLLTDEIVRDFTTFGDLAGILLLWRY
jgi:hypothetical protein